MSSKKEAQKEQSIGLMNRTGTTNGSSINNINTFLTSNFFNEGQNLSTSYISASSLV